MTDRRDLREFAEQTSPNPRDLARVRRRVLAALDERAWRAASTGRPLVRGLFAGGLVAACAVAVLVMPEPRLPGPGAAPLALVSKDAWSDLTVTPEVHLQFRGTGSIRGTRAAPRVQWRSGRLHAAVDPHRGVDFQVRTPEALVAVLGTEFDVERTAPGTTVTVQHGRVRVTCDLGPSSTLTAGGSWTCLPTTAAGLLGRARYLQRTGEPAADIIASIALGLDRPDAPAPIIEELRFVKVEVLAAAGRLPAALTEARSLLRDGAGHRRAELAAWVTELKHAPERSRAHEPGPRGGPRRR
jgi:hypothetical protein